MRQHQQIKGNLDVLLLSVLRDGSAHGYAVISELRRRSDGAFDLPEGTVYPALYRLEKAGLIHSSWSDSEGRRRRIYELNGAGAAALREQEAQWQTFAVSMQAVLGWSV